MREKHKKVCNTLNHFENFSICILTVSACVSISVFASLFGVLVVIMIFSVGLKICAITAGIKKHK